MQDYSTLFQYFDARFWDMVNTRVPMQCIEQAWYKRGFELGCRRPTEHTSRLWTAFFLAIHPGKEQCATLGSDALKAEHQRVKTAFKNISLKAEPPTDDIAILPAMPNLCQMRQ